MDRNFAPIFRLRGFAVIRRLVHLLLFVLVAIAPLPICSATASVLVVRFSHVVTADAPKGLMAARFAELVAERSHGRIRVDVYPQSKLYDDQDEMLALQLGAVEILAPSLSKFGRFGFPSFELFDLPFLFHNIDDVHRVTEGPIGRALLNDLSRQQFFGLGYLDNGFKHMSANQPLLQASDYMGLRMRIQPSRIIAAQMQALGVRQIPLALSETRTALARKVVDGTENPLSNFVTQRINEVQSHLTLTNHAYLGYAVVTNQRFWLSLSSHDRSIMEQAMAEALAYGNQQAALQDQRAIAEVRAAETTQIHTPLDVERARFEAAMNPVYEQAKLRIGVDLLDRVRRQLADQRKP